MFHFGLNHFNGLRLALGVLFFLSGHGLATAQEDAAPITFDMLGLVEQLAVPETVTIGVLRATGAPGAVFTQDPDDPTGAITVVEAGTLSAIVNEMSWTIFKGGNPNDSVSVPKGERATIETGDVYFIPGSVSGDIRNEGTEPAEVISFMIGPPEAIPEMTVPQ